MSILLSYFRDFFKTIHPGLLLFCLVYAGSIVFLNYRYGIEPRLLQNMPGKTTRFAGYYLMYLCAFGIPYLFIFFLKGKSIRYDGFLVFLVLIAPAIFAFKVNFSLAAQLILQHTAGVWGKYYALVANLPSKLIAVLIPLLLVWWMGKYDKPFFGWTISGFDARPYLLMLMIMVPLIAWASFQEDFLVTYPKLKQVAFINAYSKHTWWHKLLYEIAYGVDFVTIEMFFRGFLVLAFVRYVGQDAILPMAVFYCSIHFGKPLAECISSFFGGIILGVVVYRTGSITGGLMVHLGIAWLMEIGGYAGSILKSKT